MLIIRIRYTRLMNANENVCACVFCLLKAGSYVFYGPNAVNLISNRFYIHHFTEFTNFRLLIRFILRLQALHPDNNSL